MALQKTYIAKVFDQDGLTPLKSFTFSPEGDGILKELPQFRSTINGGLGECVLDLDLPFDDFDEGGSINITNIVDLWVTDPNNTRGRRIYRGFMSKYEPYIDDGGTGVRVTLLGLVSLLTTSYYKNGINYDVTRTSEDPTDIAKAIITQFNTIWGGSLITYDASSIPATVGTTVSVTFTDQRWSDALKKTGELAGTNWWWHVDAEGVFSMKAKPGSATHTFTIGKDIQSIQMPKDSEKIINDVQVRGDAGLTADVEDTGSQSTYGTGSPPSGKRTQVISDTSLGDTGALSQRGNKAVNDNKDTKVTATGLVINTNYDLESIKVGDTCKITNYKKGNTFFSDNMLIVGVDYAGDTVSLQVEEDTSDLGSTIAELVGNVNQSGGSSGGSGGSSSGGFVDKETPTGTINGSNTGFTLSQAPVAGSEHVWLNGFLQSPGSVDYSISGTSITFVNAPPTGSILVVSFRTTTSSVNFVDNETPSGTVDGINAAFTLAHTPTVGAEHVFLNGSLQAGSGVDYTLSGTTITFVVAPPSGSIILVSYRY